MEISNSGLLKTNLNVKPKSGNLGLTSIPTSSPHCVIIKSYKAALAKPIATLKFQTQFSDDFPLFLRGKVDEDEFRRTIEGINWFAKLLHDAEVEFYAENNTSELWKMHRDILITEEIRAEKIHEILRSRSIIPPPNRSRIKSEKDLRVFHEKCESWVQAFIDDENKRNYLRKGVQWINPTKNMWRWVEIHVQDNVNEDIPLEEIPPVQEPPVFGQNIEFVVDGSVEIGDHTEYLISVKTDISHWYPYTNYYILRRFSEFQTLHKKLKAYLNEEYFDIGIPEFPEKKVFGRMSKSTIQKRIKSFQNILDFVAGDQRLNTCEVLFDFFLIMPMFNSWKYINYIRSFYENK